MAQINSNIRIDSELKHRFEITADDTDLFYSESNMKVLAESIKQLEEGKGVEHELIEV